MGPYDVPKSTVEWDRWKSTRIRGNNYSSRSTMGNALRMTYDRFIKGRNVSWSGVASTWARAIGGLIDRGSRAAHIWNARQSGHRWGDKEWAQMYDPYTLRNIDKAYRRGHINRRSYTNSLRGIANRGRRTLEGAIRQAAYSARGRQAWERASRSHGSGNTGGIGGVRWHTLVQMAGILNKMGQRGDRGYLARKGFNWLDSQIKRRIRDKKRQKRGRTARRVWDRRRRRWVYTAQRRTKRGGRRVWDKRRRRWVKMNRKRRRWDRRRRRWVYY